MALLGELRKHIWILFILLGLAMLVFLIGDPTTLMSAFKPDSSVFGKVNGEEIRQEEYNSFVTDIQNKQPQLSNAQAQKLAWEQLTARKLLVQKAEKSGLTISDRDFWANAARHPFFSGENSLRDNNGQVDITKMKTAVADLINRGNNNSWLIVEKEIKNQALVQKYFTAIVSSVLVTDTEAEFITNKSYTKHSINYVSFPYEQLKKTEKNINVSDEEILAYAKKRPQQFEKGERRNLDYVLFEASPTAADLTAIKNSITRYTKTHQEEGINGEIETIESFRATEDPISYANAYSDMPSLNDYRPLYSFTGKVKAFIKTAKKGSVSSVLEDEDTFSLVKVVDIKKTDNGYTYKVAHLLKNKTASEETSTSAYKNAHLFIQNNKGLSANDFANNATKKGYKYFNSKDVEKRGFQLLGLQDGQDQVVEWAFKEKTDEGDTFLITTVNNNYIAVYLTKKLDKGIPNAETLRPLVEPELLNMKFALFIKEKTKGKNLESIAQNNKTKVKTASLGLSQPLLDDKYELKVASSLNGMKIGEEPKVIAGESSVFVVTLLKSKAEENKPEADLLKKQIEQQLKRQTSSLLLYSLKNAGEIEDTRP